MTALLTTTGKTNALVRAYTWGLDASGSMQGAGGVGGLLMVNAGSGGVHFPAYDLNGNVMGLVNATNGIISAKYEYGPFGEVFCSVGDMAKVNPFQFSTKYTDSETDLVYYGYRYYSPALGRWLSRDPIEEQGGLNLYGFVKNDPVNYVDVIGRQTWMPPWPGLCFTIPINIEDPTIIDTQFDAFKAWRLRKGGIYPVSQGIIDDIRDESNYRHFLSMAFLLNARGWAQCGKNGKYSSDKVPSDVFQTWNDVIGRIIVTASGRCSWKCEKEYNSFFCGCGCVCDVVCVVNVEFKDEYDFTPHKDDPWYKRTMDVIDDWGNYLLAGPGSPFFTKGNWKETLYDEFWNSSCMK